jgi:hypothetical protein
VRGGCAWSVYVRTDTERWSLAPICVERRDFRGQEDSGARLTHLLGRCCKYWRARKYVHCSNDSQYYQSASCFACSSLLRSMVFAPTFDGPRPYVRRSSPLRSTSFLPASYSPHRRDKFVHSRYSKLKAAGHVPHSAFRASSAGSAGKRRYTHGVITYLNDIPANPALLHPLEMPGKTPGSKAERLLPILTSISRATNFRDALRHETSIDTLLVESLVRVSMHVTVRYSISRGRSGRGRRPS